MTIISHLQQPLSQNYIKLYCCLSSDQYVFKTNNFKTGYSTENMMLCIALLVELYE